MDLLDERRSAVGHALHERELPQRSAPVEAGHGGGLGHVEHGAQIPRSGAARPTEVERQVEVLVDDPTGRSDAERCVDDALAQAGQEPADPLHAGHETVPARGPVELGDGHDGGAQQRIVLDVPQHRIGRVEGVVRPLRHRRARRPLGPLRIVVSGLAHGSPASGTTPGPVTVPLDRRLASCPTCSARCPPRPTSGRWHRTPGASNPSPPGCSCGAAPTARAAPGRTPA